MMRLLAAGLIALSTLAPRHDLDVAVPPGTPLEWTKELRPNLPTATRGSVPTAGASDVLDGGTTALGVDLGSTNPLGVSRITTRDLPGHLSWTVPAASKGTGDRVPTPGGAITWEYPPAVTTLQWWWVLAPLLRAGLHPNLVSDAEIGLLMLEIGEPSRAAADAAAGCGFCPDVTEMIKRDVTPVPAKRPEPPKMESPLQQMFARLAAEELTSDYPHGMNPYFAQRTLSLGDAAFPAVLACAKSEHSFLRRNAVAVLAHYGKPEGLQLLREYAATSKDAVVRVRSVLALARRRDKEIVPLLVKWLDDGDRFRRALAAHALGLSAQGEGGEPLLKKAKALVHDGEFLFSALPALARIRMNDADFTLELRALVNAVGTRQYDVAARAGADVPDAKGTRREILKEFGQLALAAQGHEGSMRGVALVAAWRPAAQYLAVEVLGGLGRPGIDALMKIVEDAQAEPVVRAQAFARVLLPVPDVKVARKAAADAAMPATVRAIAIGVLPGFDPPGAREAARPVVEAYLKGGMRAPAEAHLVQTAMQALGRLGDLDVDALLDLAGAAADQRKRLGAKRPSPKIGWQQEVEIVIDSPLFEGALIELGRTRSKRAAETLALMLEEGAGDGRAEAAFALGAIGGKRATEALLAGLDDKEGWVRWASYASLHALTGKEIFCDWIGGGAEARAECVRKWKEALK